MMLGFHLATLMLTFKPWNNKLLTHFAARRWQRACWCGKKNGWPSWAASRWSVKPIWCQLVLAVFSICFEFLDCTAHIAHLRGYALSRRRTPLQPFNSLTYRWKVCNLARQHIFWESQHLGALSALIMMLILPRSNPFLSRLAGLSVESESKYLL